VSATFRHSLRFRLGLPPSQRPTIPTPCPNRSCHHHPDISLVSQTDHAHCCTALKNSATYRHDLIVNAIRNIAENAGCVTVSKPRVQSFADRRRISDKIPDLSIDLQGYVLVTDVAVVCTTAPTYVKNRPAYILMGRENGKEKKYREPLRALSAVDGLTNSFEAFIVLRMVILVIRLVAFWNCWVSIQCAVEWKWMV